MGAVYENARTTALAGGLIMAIAVFVGYALASWIIRPVMTVISVAANIEKQNYQLEPLDAVAGRTDELGHLARVIREMARVVYQREKDLIEKVRELRIEVDEAKRTQQVSEIVDSDFFKDLEIKARQMREYRHKPKAADESPA